LSLVVPVQVLRVLRVARRMGFHGEGELRDRDRHHENLPGRGSATVSTSIVACKTHAVLYDLPRSRLD
jgi:hypothetical protein